MTLNDEFHGLINSRGGNLEAVDLIRRYYGLSNSMRRQVGRRSEYWERVRAEHHALLDAFRRHDTLAAAELGLQHVMGSLDDLLVQLETRAAGQSPQPFAAPEP